MTVSKIDAAERQLDAAIRLFFADEDWIAVHTLAAASGGILRELAKQRGGSAWDRLNGPIRPEKRKCYWGKINHLANFLKHAKREADRLPEIDPVLNEHFTRINCALFGDLEGRLSRPMAAFITWYAYAYPDTIRDDGSLFAEFRRRAASVHQGLSRAEQLAFWQGILKQNPQAERER